MKSISQHGFRCKFPALSVIAFALIAAALLLSSGSAHAETRIIHFPDGYELALYEPISIVKGDLGNGLTSYAVMDDNSDDLGEAFTIAVQTTGSGRTITVIRGEKRTEAPPGSQMEADCVALLGL